MLESRSEADTLSYKWVLEPEVDTPQEQWLNNRTNVEDQSKWIILVFSSQRWSPRKEEEARFGHGCRSQPSSGGSYHIIFRAVTSTSCSPLLALAERVSYEVDFMYRTVRDFLGSYARPSSKTVIQYQSISFHSRRLARASCCLSA